MAPTAADVETPAIPRAIAIATGTTALLLVAVLVVALAPSRSSAPSAISATTLPPATIQLQTPDTSSGSSTTNDQGGVVTFRHMAVQDQALALVGAPNAVSATRIIGGADELAVARTLPPDPERVILLTSSHAYTLRWSEIDDITAPNGSIVVTSDGRLLATFVSEELRLLVD